VAAGTCEVESGTCVLWQENFFSIYEPVLPNMGMYALLTHDICMDVGLQKARRRLRSQPNLVSRIRRSSFHFSFALEVVVINLPDSNTFIIRLQ
jgi:hypothetical protein